MKPAISTSLFWKGAFAIDGCFSDIAGAGFKFIELDAHNIQPFKSRFYRKSFSGSRKFRSNYRQRTYALLISDFEPF